MTKDEVLTLAKAGFTAMQIAALNKVSAYAEKTSPAEIEKGENDLLNQLLGQVTNLTTAVQTNAIKNAEQPKVETVDDIMASIINPINEKGETNNGSK